MNNYVALSTRVRFARNLEGLPFPHKCKGSQAEEFYQKALPIFPQWEVFFIADLSPMERAVLTERQIISPRLAVSNVGAVANKGDLSVMMMEEDVFRICAVKNGLNLSAAYLAAKGEEERLSALFAFAKMPEFGYLTSSFLNVGGGIRASVTVMLPGLTKAGKAQAALAVLEEEGLAVRGVLGEGSQSENALYQISNAHSFARTDEEVLSGVHQAARDLVELELNERRRAFLQNAPLVREEILSALRTLTAAASLSYGQAMRGVSTLMQGVSVGAITDGGVDLFQLAESLRPATLALKQGRTLTVGEEERLRAKQVKPALAAVKWL